MQKRTALLAKVSEIKFDFYETGEVIAYSAALGPDDDPSHITIFKCKDVADAEDMANALQKVFERKRESFESDQ